jgi:hypothetical protein
VKITISRPIFAGVPGGEEFALGQDGKALRFSSVKMAINFLADHNYTIEDLRELEFNVEEEADGKRS